MNTEKNKSLLLAIQRGLLGAVTSNLRGVAAEWSANNIIIYFYFDGPLSNSDKDNASVVAGETIADFKDGLIDEHYIRLDYPAKLPQHNLWAYKRQES